MAESCKESQERIEESVLQPVDDWVESYEQKCRTEPCVWWMLCLNTVFCWFATVLVKVVLWVMTILVRWVYRVICTSFMLVVGLLAVLIGNSAILEQAFKDLWELTKDSIYAAIGGVIFVALRIVDLFQSAVGLQGGKRRLTKAERAILWPIFRESLNYNAIEVVDGSAGILTTTGRALTMGWTIYLPVNDIQTLVHECVHSWQFQFEGFKYIGNSALNQLDRMTFNPGYQPYAWKGRMDAGASWYTLKSAEAQAKFIEDVFADGLFHFDDPPVDDTTNGAFFREDVTQGHHVFAVGGDDYTKQANEAWHIIRTG